MKTWTAQPIPDISVIPKGDMPGDKIKISPQHVAKAEAIFPHLLALLLPVIETGNKTVVSVYGGSGVGKSEIGSLLAYYLNQSHIGCYILSGDNYPHRIPKHNDWERLRVFRESALKGLVAAGEYRTERKTQLDKLMLADRDTDPASAAEFAWLSVYLAAGRAGLQTYLGTSAEIDFVEINSIVAAFKNSAASILLKRMGREENEIWYDRVDFSHTKVLLIEWTHGNNPLLLGVDIPILLNSTPQETLEHRKLRNRDGGADSPFTTMVLAIEQEKLTGQAVNAKLIVTKSAEIVAYPRYLALMKQGL
jgi:alpha-galactosidase